MFEAKPDRNGYLLKIPKIEYSEGHPHQKYLVVNGDNGKEKIFLPQIKKFANSNSE